MIVHTKHHPNVSLKYEQQPTFLVYPILGITPRPDHGFAGGKAPSAGGGGGGAGAGPGATTTQDQPNSSF